MSDWMNHNGIEVPDSTPGEAGEKLKTDLLTLADSRPKLVTVADDTERFTLTAEDIHVADIIAVTDGDRYYLVQDTANLDTEDGYVRLNPTAISAVADDPAPALGGDLDLDTHTLTGPGGANVFDPSGPYINGVGSYSQVAVGSGVIFDANGFQSIDWNVNRSLNDSSGYIAVDWQNRLLYDTNNGSGASIDWNNRVLFDTDGATPLLTWSGGQVGLCDVLGNDPLHVSILNGLIYADYDGSSWTLGFFGLGPTIQPTVTDLDTLITGLAAMGLIIDGR